MARAPETVRARAWCRVDFAGGTLDIWPLGLLHPGARTVNVAVSLPVAVTIGRRREAGYRVVQGASDRVAASPAELLAHADTALVGVVVEALGLPPSDVRLESGAPRGSGLGASSAMTVALLAAAGAAMGVEPPPPAVTAQTARDLEARLMGLPTGCQDHFAAMLGGALEIEHAPGGERVRALRVDLADLGAGLVVAYTGTSHFSAGSNWDIVRRRLDGEPGVTALLDSIAETATEVAAALEAGELERAGAGLDREWAARRQLASGISTPEIERFLEIGRSHGAWGGKACGAGAGGSIAMLAPAAQRNRVCEALAAAGAQVLPVVPVAAGLLVEADPIA